MAHNCFISFKKEDVDYKDEIKRILKDGFNIDCRVLEETIDSENIEYVISQIREKYIKGTSVTLFLIGEHSQENCGYENGYYKNSFIKRELIASLMRTEGNDRSGIVGIVLPFMYNKIYGERYKSEYSNSRHQTLAINDETVIREFSENYWLIPEKEGSKFYNKSGEYCVLVKYDDFIKNPNQYIDEAYEKSKNTVLVNAVKVKIDNKYNIKDSNYKKLLFLDSASPKSKH